MTNPVQRLDELRRDEHYRLHNLPRREYDESVIGQWLKNYWSFLEAGRERNELVMLVWADLNAALDSLPSHERACIVAYAEGWQGPELIVATGDPRAYRAVVRGIRGMAAFLRGDH